LNAEVVGSEKFIRAIVCNYRGMAEFALNALIGARYCFHDSLILAIEAVSKMRYKDPKFAFGNGEGIDWINDESKYVPNIFKHKQFIPTIR